METSEYLITGTPTFSLKLHEKVDHHIKLKLMDLSKIVLFAKRM